ncbi:choice-of-anchor D domain-containing protein [Terracidiphilus gabretensis]|uniref:choice-of-anchor D domain-containing protein n=1 Tax=Terracidiphilus gabretensis TaxID=1577687 RepID=UPI00071B6033|nr:choice-of-anchor D domain-containing protein [Terracidiphilus gabretensis]
MFTQKHHQTSVRICTLLSASLTFSILAAAQTAATISHVSAEPTIISLAASPQARAMHVTPVQGEPSFENTPSNFHAFASAKVGEDAGVETLTVNFSAATQITKIESKSKDFILESGGTCHEGNAYSAGQSCTLQARFSPQGAGTRTGKITIEHSASVQPFALGIGGYGYAPVLSFTPAIMTTVAGTYPASKGLLTSARNLTVDGNDTLYAADTGGNAIRSMDSSGNWTVLATGYTSPWGIAVDTMGEVYFDLSGSNNMYEIFDYGPIVQLAGTTTGACTAATPCTLSSHAIASPGVMAMDRNNNLFFADADQGVAMSTVQPLYPNLIYLYNPFPFQTNPSSPITVDSGDNLYSVWADGSECQIMQSSLYDAENSKVAFNKVAGGHTCGFAGDGGQAGNAEIGAKIGQMAWDLAGNLYFSDTSNNRIRRIDYITGQINTIAGNGAAGYTGDNDSATLGTLNAPTGVAVDSQGQVYIISSAATGQVIRKLGPNGFIYFASQIKGTASTAHTVTVSNTGNNTLTLTNAVITGANASDFKIDPVTTSCMLTAGSTLNSGQSCKIGLIFTPAAAAIRTASLVFADNTVTSSNTVQLYGAGALPSATLTINSPASGAIVTAGTAISFKVTLSGSPTPTGTVTLTLDGAALAGSPANLTTGSASVNAVTSVVGSHTLKAVYSGDANWAAGTAASVTYTVKAAAAIKCVMCGIGRPIHIISEPRFSFVDPR